MTLLAVVVAVVCVVAVNHSRPPAAVADAAAVPTFDLGVSPAPSGEPSPAPTATPTSTPATSFARDAERLLAVGLEGTLWRARAGSCSAGVAPRIDRSRDGGQTWEDVTPLYRGIAQVAGLAGFAGNQASAVAALSPGCRTAGMRTFTQGRFWEENDAVLAASTFVDPVEPAVIVTPAGRVDAPCADAVGLRSSSDAIAVICSGATMLADGGSWTDVGVPGSSAVAFSDGALYVAHVDDGCAGVAISTASVGAAPRLVGCAEAVDRAGPIAVAVASGTAYLWAGDAFVLVPIEGGIG